MKEPERKGGGEEREKRKLIDSLIMIFLLNVSSTLNTVRVLMSKLQSRRRAKGKSRVECKSVFQRGDQIQVQFAQFAITRYRLS